MPNDVSEYPVFDGHRAALRERFAARLAREAPGDVLDVGAGDGSLIASLALQGIAARGVEASDARVDAARAAGRPVERGSAVALDAGDRSVCWVTLRHVLHHLPDPETAVMEALRVARDGVMIAEPFAATGLAPHAAMERLERLLRRLDRARGAYHDDDIPPARIAGWIPAGWRVELEIAAPLTRLPAGEVQRLIARSAGGAVLSSQDQGAAAEFERAAGRGELAASGSAVVLAWRPD